MTILGDRLSSLKTSGRKALVPYVVGGFPDRRASVAAALRFAPYADVMEVGLPYSDPLMDGPVIERAVRGAIAAGTGPLDALDLSWPDGTSMVAMTYYNPVHRLGEDVFCDRLVERGFQGLIVPDLPAEASAALRAVAAERGIAWIPLVAPTSSPARVEQAVAGASGFVYAVSSLGVTGARHDLSSRAAEVVARCRAATDRPVYLGIGISTPEQAQAAVRESDGVIVGSAIVKLLAEEGVDAAAALLARIRDSLARSG